MKDAYYFSHDGNARHDPKVVTMRSAYGAEGYGWYWMLIETMREQEGYKIVTTDKYWLKSLALDMGVPDEKLSEFIADCVSEFELFIKEDGTLYSNSLIERMKRVDRRRAQTRDAANARWNKGKKKKPLPSKESNIPSLSEFLEHGKIACGKASLSFGELSFAIESKYETWVQDKWKDGNGSKILNWKSKLNNTIPYLGRIQARRNKTNSGMVH